MRTSCEGKGVGAAKRKRKSKTQRQTFQTRTTKRMKATNTPRRRRSSGVHEEAQEDDILTQFGAYGHIKNLHLNLDRRTGFLKGYALIEYESFVAAHAAISGMNGAKLFFRTISVNWAFSTGPFKGRSLALSLTCHSTHIIQGAQGDTKPSTGRQANGVI
ncbi:unnamed protein product [Dovyalis caffra]|uniref:RRM domain-containing protein n=1 Tax=Dovyalis caffra TaxID=77055 RepID=A0AAV1S0G2_9ROSI|nr:unnamed protein product [Dovyalis caffra]